MSAPKIEVRIQNTPNPLALKYIANKAFINEEKATFKRSDAGFSEPDYLPLAKEIFSEAGVLQIHLFNNVATITFENLSGLQDLSEKIKGQIVNLLPNHDSNFTPAGAKAKKKEWTDPEVIKIEEILDRTIRPGLQADGGDIEVLNFEQKILTLAYQGACGTCPSAMYGTLDAIQSILHSEYDPSISIVIDDDSLYY